MKLTNNIIKQMPQYDYCQFKKVADTSIEMLLYKADADVTALTIVEADDLINRVVIAKKGVDLIKALAKTGDGVELIFKESNLIASSSLGKFKIPFNSDSGIDERAFKEEASIDVSGKTISKALKFVSKATNKPTLTGIDMSSNHVCATDSYKLYNKGTFETPNFIIPSGFAEVLKGNETNTLVFSKTLVKVKFGDFEYTSVLIDGTYPDVSRLLKTNGQAVLCDTEEFKEAVELAALSENETIKVASKDKKLAVMTEEFIKEIDLEEEQDVSFSISKESAKVISLAGFACSMCYQEALRPITFLNDDETILILPVKGN